VLTENKTALPSPGRRIVVVGTSGSGKTFVAKQLAAILRVPFIDNDSIIHRPNWRPNPPEQRLIEFDAATRGEAWTIDGNIGALKSADDILIAQRADTMIWLDLPRRTVMRQLLRRTISRSWHNTELWHGNRESWRLSFFSRYSVLWWAWKTHESRRQQYTKIFTDPAWDRLTRIRLRSRSEINCWLASVSESAKLTAV
jgi:adenylate kinase family enzyme